MEFLNEPEPSIEQYWRAIILFGRNVASYKFALAEALAEVGTGSSDLVRLDDLAGPFARSICRHLQHEDRQATSKSSRFLDTCRKFNAGEVGEDELIATTARIGFVNVIDAFHVVAGSDVPTRFFVDERSSNAGIRVTDHLRHLLASSQSESLVSEVDSRWRLVETAWALAVTRNIVSIEHDSELLQLFAQRSTRRVAITSSRSALNGYQKGRCFYCFDEISVELGSPRLADVDHFFPHALKRLGGFADVDGVWNLVLACADCNRGVGGKFDRLPDKSFVERLFRRNEFLIASHHPLRETLMRHTGETSAHRADFIKAKLRAAAGLGIWTTEPRAPVTF